MHDQWAVDRVEVASRVNNSDHWITISESIVLELSVIHGFL